MAVVSWLTVASAWADDRRFENVLDNRLTIYGGAQFYDATGEFNSTNEGFPRITIDLDDLGLDENPVSPVAGVIFKFGKRWNLRLDYFGFNENGKRTADFSFNFGDLVVPIGARLDSSLNLNIYVVNLSYDFIYTEKARFGLGFGVHTADIDLDVSGRVTVAGREIFLGEGEEDFTAPVPNLYASGAYAFTDRFILRYGGGWLSLSYGDYEGSLWFVNASLEYWPFRHVGFGAGYRYFSADVEYNPGDRKEEYDVRFPGPVVYATLGF